MRCTFANLSGWRILTVYMLDNQIPSGFFNSTLLPDQPSLFRDQPSLFHDRPSVFRNQSSNPRDPRDLNL
jgi:hypothetical protein